MDDEQVEKLIAQIQATRLSNLEQLIGDMKNADYAREYDLDASYISQLRNRHRTFGEKAARKIELYSGLPIGSLDVNPDLDIDSKSESALVNMVESSLDWLSPEGKAALLRVVSKSM